MKPLLLLLVYLNAFGPLEKAESLFAGTDLSQWTFAPEAWRIDEQAAMTCAFDRVTKRNGETALKSRGYIWTRKSYADFELRLSYKLSPGANSGVFFRTDPSSPVQKGFEIQLMDDEGFQKSKGRKDAKNLNGALYDCQAADEHKQKAVGEWNTFKLSCRKMEVVVTINGEVINRVNLDRWDKAKVNPDGTSNKFNTALNKLPRQGYIGFQNHGQPVWFKDIEITEY